MVERIEQWFSWRRHLSGPGFDGVVATPLFPISITALFTYFEIIVAFISTHMILSNIFVLLVMV